MISLIAILYDVTTLLQLNVIKFLYIFWSPKDLQLTGQFICIPKPGRKWLCKRPYWSFTLKVTNSLTSFWSLLMVTKSHATKSFWLWGVSSLMFKTVDETSTNDPFAMKDANTKDLQAFVDYIYTDQVREMLQQTDFWLLLTNSSWMTSRWSVLEEWLTQLLWTMLVKSSMSLIISTVETCWLGKCLGNFKITWNWGLKTALRFFLLGISMI